MSANSGGLGMTCSVDTHGCMTFSESGLVPRLALFCSFHTATTYLGERVFSHGHEHRRQPMRGKKLRKRKEGPIHRTHRIFHPSSVPGVNERQMDEETRPSRLSVLLRVLGTPGLALRCPFSQPGARCHLPLCPLLGHPPSTRSQGQ